MAARPGFIVQNAVTVGANLDLAEPDALDFNLLGNTKYGVITGCDPSVTGAPGSFQVSIAPGVAVVNGQLVYVNGSCILPGPGQAPRFDLVAVDAGGVIKGIQGTADPNPVFPQYDNTVTILASVMMHPGQTWIATGDVTDKRVMLMERFLTAIKDGSLLRNVSPIDMSLYFDLAYDGHITWDGDGTALERSATKTLRVHDNLDVVASLTAGSIG